MTRILRIIRDRWRTQSGPGGLDAGPGVQPYPHAAADLHHYAVLRSTR